MKVGIKRFSDKFRGFVKLAISRKAAEMLFRAHTPRLHSTSLALSWRSAGGQLVSCFGMVPLTVPISLSCNPPKPGVILKAMNTLIMTPNKPLHRTFATYVACTGLSATPLNPKLLHRSDSGVTTCRQMSLFAPCWYDSNCRRGDQSIFT